jgi:hypothetical protein
MLAIVRRSHIFVFEVLCLNPIKINTQSSKTDHKYKSLKEIINFLEVTPTCITKSNNK